MTEAPPIATGLSVIVPCLNVAHVLAIQLDALAGQRCAAPWEVVIADNGSIDATRDVAESFRGRLPELQIVAARPRGRHHACNAGARAARGKHLVFVDADDEVAPGFLSAMREALEEHELVGGRLEHLRLNPDAGRDVGHVQSTGLMQGFGLGPFVMGANMGVRRDLFERLGGFQDKAFCEDVDFCWRALAMGIRPVFVPAATVHYRQRTTPRLMFRQHRQYGAAHALLYREFRARGMARRAPSEVARDWMAIGRSLLVLSVASPGERQRWLRRLARAVGRLSGSVRYRVFYP